MSSNNDRGAASGTTKPVQANWIETQCLLCGTNVNTTVKYEQSFSVEHLGYQTFSARRETEHYHYRLLQCRTCGMVFSSPVLAPSQLAELYRGSKLTYSRELSAIAGTYIAHFRRHAPALPAKTSALEIGCGNGFFLRELLKFGFAKVQGVEPSEDAVAQAGELKERIYCGFFEDADLPAESFDLICCFHTLDHVVDPMAVLRKAFRLLRPGGVVYVIVHNERAPQARLFGEKSPIYDVEHVYLFNPQTLTRACERAGFGNTHVFSVYNTYPLEYWLRMSPLPAKHLLQTVAHWLHLVNVPVTIPAGNLGIVAQKPLASNQ